MTKEQGIAGLTNVHRFLTNIGPVSLYRCTEESKNEERIWDCRINGYLSVFTQHWSSEPLPVNRRDKE